jgi:hypothetical protein
VYLINRIRLSYIPHLFSTYSSFSLFFFFLGWSYRITHHIHIEIHLHWYYISHSTSVKVTLLQFAHERGCHAHTATHTHAGNKHLGSIRSCDVVTSGNLASSGYHRKISQRLATELYICKSRTATQRVAKCDRTAVHIHLFHWYLQMLHGPERLTRKCFIDLEEVNV